MIAELCTHRFENLVVLGVVETETAEAFCECDA